MELKRLLNQALGRLDHYRCVEDFEFEHCRYIVVQEGHYVKCIVLDRTGTIKADVFLNSVDSDVEKLMETA